MRWVGRCQGLSAVCDEKQRWIVRDERVNGGGVGAVGLTAPGDEGGTALPRARPSPSRDRRTPPTLPTSGVAAVGASRRARHRAQHRGRPGRAEPRSRGVGARCVRRDPRARHGLRRGRRRAAHPRPRARGRAVLHLGARGGSEHHRFHVVEPHAAAHGRGGADAAVGVRPRRRDAGRHRRADAAAGRRAPHPAARDAHRSPARVPPAAGRGGVVRSSRGAGAAGPARP